MAKRCLEGANSICNSVAWTASQKLFKPLLVRLLDIDPIRARCEQAKSRFDDRRVELPRSQRDHFASDELPCDAVLGEDCAYIFDEMLRADGLVSSLPAQIVERLQACLDKAREFARSAELEIRREIFRGGFEFAREIGAAFIIEYQLTGNSITDNDPAPEARTSAR
jgi:hypothetical protein